MTEARGLDFYNPTPSNGSESPPEEVPENSLKNVQTVRKQGLIRPLSGLFTGMVLLGGGLTFLLASSITPLVGSAFIAVGTGVAFEALFSLGNWVSASSSVRADHQRIENSFLRNSEESASTMTRETYNRDGNGFPDDEDEMADDEESEVDSEESFWEHLLEMEATIDRLKPGRKRSERLIVSHGKKAPCPLTELAGISRKKRTAVAPQDTPSIGQLFPEGDASDARIQQNYRTSENALAELDRLAGNILDDLGWTKQRKSDRLIERLGKITSIHDQRYILEKMAPYNRMWRDVFLEKKTLREICEKISWGEIHTSSDYEDFCTCLSLFAAKRLSWILNNNEAAMRERIQEFDQVLLDDVFMKAVRDGSSQAAAEILQNFLDNQIFWRFRLKVLVELSNICKKHIKKAKRDQILRKTLIELFVKINRQTKTRVALMASSENFIKNFAQTIQSFSRPSIQLKLLKVAIQQENFHKIFSKKSDFETLISAVLHRENWNGVALLISKRISVQESDSSKTVIQKAIETNEFLENQKIVNSLKKAAPKYVLPFFQTVCHPPLLQELSAYVSALDAILQTLEEKVNMAGPAGEELGKYRKEILERIFNRLKVRADGYKNEVALRDNSILPALKSIRSCDGKLIFLKILKSTMCGWTTMLMRNESVNELFDAILENNRLNYIKNEKALVFILSERMRVFREQFTSDLGRQKLIKMVEEILADREKVALLKYAEPADVIEFFKIIDSNQDLVFKSKARREFFEIYREQTINIQCETESENFSEIQAMLDGLKCLMKKIRELDG